DPQAILVVIDRIDGIVAGQVEADSTAAVVEAAAGHPVPAHHGRVVALVIIHQQQAVGAGKDNRLIAEPQFAGQRQAALVRIHAAIVGEGDADDLGLAAVGVGGDGAGQAGHVGALGDVEADVDAVGGEVVDEANAGAGARPAHLRV